jgi:hydroxyacylglutathione hydrolase
MTPIFIQLVPCLKDNYAFLVHEPRGAVTALVDTPEVEPVERALASTRWRLTHILNTHHHADHAGCNLAFKEKWRCTIVGPKADRDRIPGIDIALGDGETFELGNAPVRVIDVPGHTRGHIAYHFPNDDAAFVGDTLFALGCGRLFEGTPSQMWSSLSKLMALPDKTRVFCAHEYTQANARFAITVDPENAALRERFARVDELRGAGAPTIPTSIGLEKATNPFLRATTPGVQAALGMIGAPAVDVFAETRRRKDRF